MNLRVKPEAASESEETLYTLATRYYIENDGDVSAATNKLFRYLSGNKEYLRSIIASAIAVAAKNAVGEKMRTERRDIYRAASAAGQGRQLADAVVAGAKIHALMESTIWGGKKLGDSTREDLIYSADKYGALKLDCGRKEKFQRAIARLVPEKKTVREVLDETKLTKLWGAAA